MTYKELYPALMGNPHLLTKDQYGLQFRKGKWHVLGLHRDYTIEEVENSKVLQIMARPDFDFMVVLDIEGYDEEKERPYNQWLKR